jgi:hypothetical protein
MQSRESRASKGVHPKACIQSRQSSLGSHRSSCCKQGRHKAGARGLQVVPSDKRVSLTWRVCRVIYRLCTCQYVHVHSTYTPLVPCEIRGVRVTRRFLSQVRRREAEEHARRMNLLFPSAAAAAEDLPPPPPKVWQRDKDQQESLLASKMVETSESELN